MARMKFTDSAVAEAAAGPGAARAEFWDTELPGFGLRISENGRKSWQLMYRIDGRKRRMTLGRYPALPLELARDTAFEALREVAKGRDPAAERAALTGGAMTFEALARAYIERYAKPRKQSWAVDERMIERDLLPAWRRKPADSLTRRDVIELVDRVAARGHLTAANRRLALIRKMFAWGVEADLVPTTPVVAVKPPASERPRERVLTDGEIAALWQAWDRVGWPFGPLSKLMLVTGQRRGVVAGLRLADIALADQVWRLPPEAVRGGGSHEVPLTAFAIDILTFLPRADSVYVFPARGRPGRPVSGFSEAAKRIARESGVADCRFDDLRRTALVGMSRQGVSRAVIDSIGNRHRDPDGVFGGADRGVDIEAKRQALEGWSARLEQILAPAT